MAQIFQTIERVVSKPFTTTPVVFFSFGLLWLTGGIVMTTFHTYGQFSSLTALGGIFVYLGGSEKFLENSPLRWISRIFFLLLFALMLYHTFHG
jgi:hypothetical protein